MLDASLGGDEALARLLLRVLSAHGLADMLTELALGRAQLSLEH
jgi:hypothetical protein